MESRSEQQRKYYREHKEFFRKYYREHKDEIKERATEWNKKNKDKINETARIKKRLQQKGLSAVYQQPWALDDAPKDYNCWNDKDIISFSNVCKAVNFLPYASQYRCMFLMLALTGMRIAELDRCFKSNLQGRVLIWRLGKNQRTWRKELLPDFFVNELKVFWQNEPTKGDKMFLCSAESFTRKFHKLRPKIGGEWNKKVKTKGRNTQWAYDWVLQLKNLRKNFWTFDYYRNLQKFPEHLALLLTARRARHKSEFITGVHYAGNFDKLECERYKSYEMAQVLERGVCQKRLDDFGISPPLEGKLTVSVVRE